MTTKALLLLAVLCFSGLSSAESRAAQLDVFEDGSAELFGLYSGIDCVPETAFELHAFNDSEGNLVLLRKFLEIGDFEGVNFSNSSADYAFWFSRADGNGFAVSTISSTFRDESLDSLLSAYNFVQGAAELRLSASCAGTASAVVQVRYPPESFSAENRFDFSAFSLQASSFASLEFEESVSLRGFDKRIHFSLPLKATPYSEEEARVQVNAPRAVRAFKEARLLLPEAFALYNSSEKPARQVGKSFTWTNPRGLEIVTGRDLLQVLLSPQSLVALSFAAVLLAAAWLSLSRPAGEKEEEF